MLRSDCCSLSLVMTCVALLTFPGFRPEVCGDEPRDAPFLHRRELPRFQMRFLCWNVNGNSIFLPDGRRVGSFERIVRAVAPDVVCLQEVIGPGRVDALVDQMNSWLPLPGETSWHAFSASDNVVVSRFPLRDGVAETPVPFPLPQFGLPDYHYGHAMCTVDLPDEHSQKDLFVVAVHNRSFGGEDNVRMRQRQSDAIVAGLRARRMPEHPQHLPDGTPLVILGDLNVLAVEPADSAHHLTTLLTGNIVDEATWGPDFVIDYDGTHLIEVKPRHNGRDKEFYTWREDASAFPPGALDRILYTDSVLSLVRSYVLNTTAMTDGELRESGLLAADVLWDATPGHFDHLPLVADFAIPIPAEK